MRKTDDYIEQHIEECANPKTCMVLREYYEEWSGSHGKYIRKALEDSDVAVRTGIRLMVTKKVFDSVKADTRRNR